MRIKKYLLSVLLLLSCVLIQAETGNKLKLNTVLNKFKENFLIKMNLLSLQSAGADYKDTMSSLYPSVSGTVPLTAADNSKTTGSYLGTDYTINNSASFTISPELTLNQYLPTAGTLSLTVKNETSVSSNGSIDPESLESELGGTEKKYQNTPSIGISLNQPVFFGNAYGAGKRTAENIYKIARHQFLLNQNNLVISLLKDYFQLQYLKYSRHLIKTRLTDAEANYKSSEKMLSLGKTTNLELLKSKAALMKAEIDLDDAESNFSKEKADFYSKYGLKSTEIIDTEIENICDYSVLKNKAGIKGDTMAFNISLAIENYNLNITKDSLINLKYSHAPVLNIYGNVAFSTAADEDTYFKAAIKNSFNDNSNPVITAGISFSASIFDAGSLEDKTDKLKYQIMESEYQIRQERIDILSQLNDLFNKIEKNIKLNKYVQLNTKIAGLEYRKAEKDFKLGRITQNDLNKLRMEQENAKLSLLNNKIEVNMNYINLLNLEGKDLLSALIEK